MNLERDVREKIIARLYKYMQEGEPLMFWRIENAMMSNFPDILMCYNGMFVVIELKRSEKTKARLGQEKVMNDIESINGKAKVIGSLDQLEEFIECLKAI